jgi:hypothetical protein
VPEGAESGAGVAVSIECSSGDGCFSAIVPATALPSFHRHTGPAPWMPTCLPCAVSSFASGAMKVHAGPVVSASAQTQHAG